jgi:hypothetical protein
MLTKDVVFGSDSELQDSLAGDEIINKAGSGPFS